MKRNPRVLFILKYRHQYSSYSDETFTTKSSGLLNSARFVQDMLLSEGYDSKLVEVIDNNDIDREVYRYAPDIVIIEALWVVPPKFEILRKLYPNIKWVLRIHSEIPFLSNEGVAIQWINESIAQKNVYVGFNSYETHQNFVDYIRINNHHLAHKALYMPNYYPVSDTCTPYRLDNESVINVGCFGAIRPMKNQLIQAFAAIEFAKSNNIGLRFHINSSRLDDPKNASALKNIRELFKNLPSQFALVEHDWLLRKEFLNLVRRMDIGLQMSLSETFNIVAADFVNMDVPILVSSEIEWMPKYFRANPTDVNDIVRGMQRTLAFKKWFGWLKLSKYNLMEVSKDSICVWKRELRKLFH